MGLMSLEWEHVIVHTAHPSELGRWWAEALGWLVVWKSDDEYSIRPVANRMPGLTFVTMLEVKVGKSRLHLGFHSGDQKVEVDRLLGMGPNGRKSDKGSSHGSCSPIRRAMNSAFWNPPLHGIERHEARSFW